jgi:hypothetical protein
MVRFSDARYWHKIESEIRPRYGFQMLTVKPNILYPDTAKLDHFGIKKIFFYDTFLYKMV